MAAAKRPAGVRAPSSASSSTPALSASVSSNPATQHAHDRLCLLLLVLVGQTVVATLKGGVRVQGILSAATTDGEVSVALRQAVYLDNNDDDDSSPPKPSLIINAKDLLEVEATDVVLDPPSSTSTAQGGGGGKPNQDSFRTDTDISGLPPPSRPRERDLQAWSAGADAWGAGGIEDGSSNGIGGLSLDDDFSKSTSGKRGPAGGGAWDQFAANERMYGLKTDYNEEIYTTKLDRNTKDFKDREARAAQLEREILKGSSGLAANAHMAEERGEQVDDGDINEEDRYGAVQRNPGAYVPPGARKAALARLGGTSPNPPSTNGSSSSPAPSSNASTQPASSSNASTQPAPVSRIPPTVRIPGASSVTSNVQGTVPTPSKTHPPVDDKFRDFVREEKERLEKKKAQLLQQQAKAEKDSRLRSLVQFSQSFKNPYPITDEIANMMHGKKSPAASDPASLKASSTTVSPAAAPRQLPTSVATNGAKLAPPSSGQQPAPSKVPAPVTKKSILLADIPPFNPAKAAARQAELAAQKAAKEGGGTTVVSDKATSPSPAPVAGTSPLTPQAPKSKISATAAPFVFKPNPNATSFTPGSSTSSAPPRKPSVASTSPAPSPRTQPMPAAVASGSTQAASAPPNPFFGTKPLKRAGSSSLNVKEDFTPFRLNAVLPDPTQAAPSWPFTGKPYRSMYPPQPTPLSLADEQAAQAAAYQNAILAQQQAAAAAAAMSGLDPSVSPGPQALLAQSHPHHPMSMHPSLVQGVGGGGNNNGGPAPPPPGSAAAALAMGMPYPGMNVHPSQQQQPPPPPPPQQQQQQQPPMGVRQMYPQMTNGGGGAGGHPNRAGGGGGGQPLQGQHGSLNPHSHPHHQHQQQQQQQQQQQMQFVPPAYHLQAMSMGQPGGHMYTSPSMQPQPTPQTGLPPQPSPRYAPYHPYSVQPGTGGVPNGPPPPPPGSVPPQGFVQ